MHYELMVSLNVKNKIFYETFLKRIPREGFSLRILHRKPSQNILLLSARIGMISYQYCCFYIKAKRIYICYFPGKLSQIAL